MARYNSIEEAKKGYDEARAKGSAQGMREANEAANAIRASQGQAAQWATDDIVSTASGQYQSARDSKDWAGMQAANEEANRARNNAGQAAQFADEDIQKIYRESGGGGGGYATGGGMYQPGQVDPGQNLYGQLLGEIQSRFDEIQAQQEAAKKAAVEQAVGQLTGQKSTVEQNYQDLYRQLYLNRRMSEKNLPQQLAAMGISGGLTESTALGLQTSYNDALRQGEQAKQGTLSDIDRAIQDARLSGDISIAEQAAQTAKDRLSAYGSAVGAMQGQQNWAQQFGYQQFVDDRNFGYQAGRDQVSDSQWQQSFEHNKNMDLQNLNRQQLLDEINRSDVDFERKLAAGQYLYENTGDASGLQILGYTPDQIAALHGSYLTQQSAKSTGGGDSSSQKKPVLSYSNMWDAINKGSVTPAVKAAWEYYMGEPWPEERETNKTDAYFEDGAQMSAGYSSTWGRVRTMFDSGKSKAEIASVINAALANGRITQAEAGKMLKSLGMGG